LALEEKQQQTLMAHGNQLLQWSCWGAERPRAGSKSRAGTQPCGFVPINQTGAW